MDLNLALPLVGIFISVALAAGSLPSMALARSSPARRRLEPAASGTARVGLFDQLFTFFRPAKNPAKQLAKVPRGTSTKVARLQRRVDAAGWKDPDAVN